MNTVDFLSIAAAICPDRAAVIFEGKKFTFADVSERSNRLANAMIKLGVKKGDRVAMLQVNSPQYLEAYFATAKMGGIFVPLNFRAKPDELTYMANYGEAQVIFCGDRYAETVNKMKPELKTVKTCVALDAKRPDMVFYEDFLASGSADEVTTEIGDDDPTILMFTAGTTGRPKGVPQTHKSFSVYALQNVEPVNPDLAETNILTVPLYHVAGIQAMLAAVYGGRTIAMMRQFETKEWMETVQREKANRAMLVPTMLKWIIDSPDFKKYNLSSLRVITYGAAPMPFEVIKKAIEVLPGVRFINAFGQTETSSTITTLGPEDHIIEGTPEEKEKKLRRLQSSIGRPMSDVDMRVIDENGNPLPHGQTGEIVARGPRVMSGYWKDAEKTAKAFTKDGWLRTSDMGWMDDEGYFYLAGRGDDMIIRGGENISPEEVENAVYTNPKVEEVAVIGLPDVEWGQQIMAVVVLKKGQTATLQEIIDSAKSKVASFKAPAYVVFTDALPRNPMGKILKRELRAKYAQKK